jgi:hypothetical protein
VCNIGVKVQEVDSNRQLLSGKSVGYGKSLPPGSMAVLYYLHTCLLT